MIGFLESLKKIWGYTKGLKYFLPAIVIMLLTIEKSKNNSFGGLFIFLFVIFAFFYIVIYSLFAFFFGDIQAKNKAKKIMPPAFTNVALYFFFLVGILNDIFYIPFYKLDPAYYKYQSECEKMPKPVVYDEDIWEIANNWDNLPKITDKEGKRFYYSEKLKKKFYGSRDWEPKRVFEKTWWGQVTKINDFYGNKLFSTRTVYYFDGLVFRFGVKKIGFEMEDVSCANAKKVLF